MGDKQKHFRVIRFMVEASFKLGLKAVPLATAANVYHKFYQQATIEEYDPYLIATTCLYLASKADEDHLKIRDVINVCYRCVHPNAAPLDMGTTYHSLKDSVAECELLLLRAVQFNVAFTHPHKYLLYYLQSLHHWLPPEKHMAKHMMTSAAWSLLQDSFHGSLCLRYKSKHIAVAVLYLAVQCYGIVIPGQSSVPWWKALVHGVQIGTIRAIIAEIIDLYDLETTFAAAGRSAASLDGSASSVSA